MRGNTARSKNLAREKNKIMKTNNNTISFKANFRTADVLGVTTQKVLYPDGMEGVKRVINTLNDRPVIGNRGYKHIAGIIGKKITDKYPGIKAATEEINNALNNEPKNTASVLNEIIHKLGAEIDIII